MKRFIIGIVMVIMAFSAYTVAQQMTSSLRYGQILQVGSGAEIEVKSGGSVDVESGGYLKIAGTAVTSTAAELNRVDGTGISSGKYIALTATTAWSDTTGMVGPTLFVTDGDSLMVYLPDHTLVAIYDPNT